MSVTRTRKEVGASKPEPTRGHVLLENVSWKTYAALLADLGERRRYRMFYDRGLLEIISPSSKHEKLKKLIGRLIETFTLENRIKIVSVGSTTWKSALRARGAEADESYYVQNEPKVRGKEDIDLDLDPPPDLVVETDITTSVLDRLNIYTSLGVREIWRHDGSVLTIYQLKADGQYQVLKESAVLPMLPMADLEKFIDQRHQLDETELVWAFRDWTRRQFNLSS